MPVVGIAAAILCAAGLAAATARARRVRPFGWPGWLGAAVAGGCAAILASPVSKPAGLGALAWSGYVLAADSAVFSLRGRSLIRSCPDRFVWLAALSIFLWIPFEWYNLRLAGWYRAGLPLDLSRHLLLGWSFACIWPALFETADLLLAIAGGRASMRAALREPSARLPIPPLAAGAACLVVPLLVPRLDFGQHLLPLAGVGFLLALDPVNAAAGRPSLWRDWLGGNRARVLALMSAGLLCGLLADCLNLAAAARVSSLYAFGASRTVVGWPVAAYLAFPVFGLQAFAMHVFAAGVLGLPAAPVPSSEEESGTRAGR